ncbi:MAG: transglycosylase SLT domain-containing protein [Rubrivivax sp.]
MTPPRPPRTRSLTRRPWRTLLGTAALALLAATLATPVAWAQQASADDLVLEAREAFRKADRARLAALRSAAARTNHPLASWVEYWELGARLNAASVDEVEAFYGRWRGAYVEDRLRNDFLLELGRRRDWPAFARDFPRFRMNDDREVTCYALLTQHLAGQDVAQAARAAWFAQRDPDDGCQLLARTLLEARKLQAADAWQKAWLAAEADRPRAVRNALALLGAAEERASADAVDNPFRFLRNHRTAASLAARQRLVLAVIRAAAQEPATVAELLVKGLESELTAELLVHAWAAVGRQAAMKLQPEAASYYARAMAAQARLPQAAGLSDETLAWQARAALRAPGDPARWPLVLQAVEAMSPAEQKDPAWVYWKARALAARPAASTGASASTTPEDTAQASRQLLQSIASPLSFYGKLALEELGVRLTLPPAPAALSDTERQAAAAHPGLQRGLRMIAIGLRPEGVREWNFSLRGMGDRELIAAAQLACDREVWDRCINTSDRTRSEFQLAQRFPTPFRDDVLRAAGAIGLDPAYVYGLIRQESRFILDARSHVGASGLMQLMPATARWTAKKVGVAWKPELITDREMNLRLGTTYLKLVLDDFGGSAALAAAAYNAGPGRPRRWREGPSLEPAAWAESIPFNETRDYVKKVLSNATVYAGLLRPEAPNSLKARLGKVIGPREAGAGTPDRELP